MQRTDSGRAHYDGSLFEPGAFPVAGRDLPLHAAVGLDRVYVSVSLTWAIIVRSLYRPDRSHCGSGSDGIDRGRTVRVGLDLPILSVAATILGGVVFGRGEGGVWGRSSAFSRSPFSSS
nr:hypothetical protein [Pseudorhizobium flavum]